MGKSSEVKYSLYKKEGIKNLNLIYTSVFAKLKDLLDFDSTSKFQKYRIDSLTIQLNTIIEELNSKTYKWANESIKENYLSGVEFTGTYLRKGKVVRTVDPNALIHRSAIESLALSMARELVVANESVKGVAERFIRRTQLLSNQDREISKLIAEGILTGYPRRSTSDRIYRMLKEQIKEGNFITIGGRRYNADTYATLVARTRQREASSLGVINTSLQYGVDLVQVSEHTDIDGNDICNEMEGKIFSISGTNTKYSKLEIYPPFHPNCRHVLLPLVVEPEGVL